MNQQLRKKVAHLRSQGKTYQEINTILGVDIPKSTLAYWCKNIPTPDFYEQKVREINLNNLKNARKLAILTNKKKQEELVKKLLNKNKFLVTHLNKDVCKLLLSILYLGEGAKHKGTRSLRLGSSSPLIIRLYLKLLKKCFPVVKEKFRVVIQCRADQNIEYLEKFWQSVTNIDKSQFYKTRIDKRTVGKKTLKKDYKGVCVIMYFNTKIQLEIELLSGQIEDWL